MNKGLVRHWMTRDVITVTPQTHLNDARRIMNAEQIRALPVMNGAELVGIVTRRGLMRSDVSMLDTSVLSRRVDLGSLTIGDIMTTNVITIKPQSVLPKAARVMLENKITALPVLDDHRALVGILTASDLFRVVIEEVPELKEDISVRDYMTPEVVTIDPDTPLLEIHRLMGVKRIRALPVMQDGQLAGIVTRTDLLSADPSRFAAKGEQDISRQVESTPAERIMTCPVVTVSTGATVVEAAGLMLERKFHSLPVVDAEGNLAGIITESDLFRLIVQKFF